jgi:uncharacterized membrane protein YfcA
LEFELLGLAALGLVIGAYGTVVGAGGGFILVPVLLLLYPELDPDQLTAISLGVVFLNAVSGSVAYARQKRIDYLTALLFAGSSAPAVVGGAILIEHVPVRLFTGLFGIMLLVLAYTSSRKRSQAIRPPLRGRGVLRRAVADPEGRQYVYAYYVWHGVALALVIGFISSLFGIGGGVMQVPAMIILLHIPLQFAVATSLFSLSFMSGGASIVHLASGTLGGDEATKILALAVGAVPGAQIGAALAQRIKARAVLLLLVSGIAVLGVRLLVKAVTDL